MAELNCPEDLPQYLPNSILIQTVRVSLQLVKYCVVHKLKHKKESLLAAKNFYQINKVVMS